MHIFEKKSLNIHISFLFSYSSQLFPFNLTFFRFKSIKHLMKCRMEKHWKSNMACLSQFIYWLRGRLDMGSTLLVAQNKTKSFFQGVSNSIWHMEQRGPFYDSNRTFFLLSRGRDGQAEKVPTKRQFLALKVHRLYIYRGCKRPIDNSKSCSFWHFDPSQMLIIRINLFFTACIYLKRHQSGGAVTNFTYSTTIFTPIL